MTAGSGQHGFAARILSFKDRCWYTLRCSRCDSTESLAVSDQGVSWSGADWEAGAPFSKFETEWTGGGHMEPELARVACRECGDAAQVVQRYP